MLAHTWKFNRTNKQKQYLKRRKHVQQQKDRKNRCRYKPLTTIIYIFPVFFCGGCIWVKCSLRCMKTRLGLPHNNVDHRIQEPSLGPQVDDKPAAVRPPVHGDLQGEGLAHIPGRGRKQSWGPREKQSITPDSCLRCVVTHIVAVAWIRFSVLICVCFCSLVGFIGLHTGQNPTTRLSEQRSEKRRYMNIWHFSITLNIPLKYQLTRFDERIYTHTHMDFNPLRTAQKIKSLMQQVVLFLLFFTLRMISRVQTSAR